MIVLAAAACAAADYCYPSFAFRTMVLRTRNPYSCSQIRAVGRLRHQNSIECFPVARLGLPKAGFSYHAVKCPSECLVGSCGKVPLVANADKVCAQLLNGVGGTAGLHGLRVVCDEKRLLGLDDDDALLALQ